MCWQSASPRSQNRRIKPVAASSTVYSQDLRSATNLSGSRTNFSSWCSSNSSTRLSIINFANCPLAVFFQSNFNLSRHISFLCWEAKSYQVLRTMRSPKATSKLQTYNMNWSNRAGPNQYRLLVVPAKVPTGSSLIPVSAKMFITAWSRPREVRFVLIRASFRQQEYNEHQRCFMAVTWPEIQRGKWLARRPSAPPSNFYGSE